MSHYFFKINIVINVVIVSSYKEKFDFIKATVKFSMIDNYIKLSNWNWKVQASVGVRFGAGKDRLQRALYGNDASKLANDAATQLNDATASPNDGPKKSRLPRWLTDFFWSPKD